MSREYPDTVAGPYDPPPRAFTDGAGRDIEVHAYGEGPVEEGEASDASRVSSDADASDGEFEAMVDMYVDYDPEDRAQGIPPAGEEKVRDWLETVLADECFNVVAWHDDRVAGHATLVPDRHGGYELAIFVASEYQQAGIGTELMKALLGLGREQGADRVWLTVERWNDAATTLYEKVGFERSQDSGFEIEMAARLA